MENRKNCPMRHENGNCLPCGGFCLAVNDEICEALQNAYRHGHSDASNVIPMYKECAGYACRGLTEQEFENLCKEYEPKMIYASRHGRWVHDYNNLYGCSECMERETMSHKKLKPYCPNCGAKMDGDINV